MATINVKDVLALVIANTGKFCGATFVKRTTGQLRRMSFLYGTRTYCVGGDRAYDPNYHNLIWVADMKKRARRSIPLDGLLTITVNGVKYTVDQTLTSEGVKA